MATPGKCAACGKTVYPLEAWKAADKLWHKLCFKCNECKMTLNLKNFKAVDGKIFCFTHTPVQRTTAMNSVSNQTAMKAPKKVSEGLGNVQKGTGAKPNVGLDTVATKNAMNAPKKKTEGLGTVQKGAHGVKTIGVPPAGGTTSGESGHEEVAAEQTYEEQPAEQTYEEQPAEQTYEEQAYEEQPAEAEE